MASGNIVKLDVGGTVFKTTKSTLTKFEGFFKAMFESGVPLTTDESGCVFIDRDPKQFGYVLNYMRDGHVDLPNSGLDVAQILREAQYYSLDGLIQLCGGDPSQTWKDANLPSTTCMLTDAESDHNCMQERCLKHDLRHDLFREKPWW